MTRYTKDLLKYILSVKIDEGLDKLMLNVSLHLICRPNFYFFCMFYTTLSHELMHRNALNLTEGIVKKEIFSKWNDP